MQAFSVVSIVLFQCGLGLPIVLVWGVAGVFIAQRMETHRTAALMALGGIALGVIELIIGIFGSASTPYLVQQGAGAAVVTSMLTAISIVRTILGVVSWGLVLAGFVMVLGKRDSREEM